MIDLTDRQVAILKAVIEEYIDTAEPVSSDTIDKKYNLGVSPATIRNEMVQLSQAGLIKKPHVSAGRVPTPMGLKYYVRNLVSPAEIPVKEEVAVKERIWEHRQKMEELMLAATEELARRTQTLAISITPEPEVYWSGMANILDFPEFWDIDLTQTLLTLIEDEPYWLKLLDQVHPTTDVGVLLGDDFGIETLRPCGFVFTRFKVRGKDYTLGIIGPGRCHYRQIIPLVDYFGRLITNLS